MNGLSKLVGPHQSLQIFGVRLVGLNAENGRKLVLTIVFLGIVWLVGFGVRFLSRSLDPRAHGQAFSILDPPGCSTCDSHSPGDRHCIHLV